jgi:ParB-like chromosome segregation protein Spo0J
MSARRKTVKKPKMIPSGKKPAGKHQSNERRKRGGGSGSGRTTVPQAPPPADPGTSPSYKAYDVVVSEIEVLGKRRQINPEKVKELKESVAEIGLRTPITIRVVNGTKQLITGLHRLEAVKALGWKKIPAVKIKGGKKVARLWEISENLHRAELTALEESELIAEWLQLTGAEKEVSAENGQKQKPGRPKGGIAAAARKLPGKGTETAKRKKITGAVKIAGIDSEVKQAAVDAGLADSKTKLAQIAEEKGKEAQLAKVKALAKRSGKAGHDTSNEDTDKDDDTEPPLVVLKREWKKAKKLRVAWKDAPLDDRRAFIIEDLEYPLDEEPEADDDEYDDEADD